MPTSCTVATRFILSPGATAWTIGDWPGGTRSEPAQRVWDLRPDWWAAKIGFKAPPKVERLIYLTYMDETKRVQNLLTNHIDTDRISGTCASCGRFRE